MAFGEPTNIQRGFLLAIAVIYLLFYTLNKVMMLLHRKKIIRYPQILLAIESVVFQVYFTVFIIPNMHGVLECISKITSHFSASESLSKLYISAFVLSGFTVVILVESLLNVIFFDFKNKR